MSIRTPIVTGAALASMSIGIAAHAQPALTAPQKETVRTEAAAAIQTYYRNVRERNPQAVQKDAYRVPWTIIGSTDIMAFTSGEQTVSHFEGLLDKLTASDWGKSEFTIEHVCALNASSAIVTGYNTRSKVDGSVMSVNWVTYVLARAPDGWTILTFTTTPQGQVVRCE